MAKYIVVTGGVVSGLGKGITTASVGLLLKNSGLSVDVIKFDPYLNIDPGTMSPYEHGEVYVLNDGSETDLDLGHYERFLGTNLTKSSSVSSGKIYNAILDQERKGDFLGKNVQLIPHVTNYIKYCFSRDLPQDQNHIRLIEIGGSTGDMEGEIFLESFRQFRRENPGQILHIHLGYIPFLKCSAEYKTKPLQNSIRQLLSCGLQPDVIIARYYAENGQMLSKEALAKVALFSNLPSNHVVSLPDLESIYKVPPYLKDSALIPLLEQFSEKTVNTTLPEFYSKFGNYNTDKTVKIGIIAKYPKLNDAYLSLLESLKIAAVDLEANVERIFIDAEKLEKNNPQELELLDQVDGILVPGGFGLRGMEGKVLASKYAREQKKPFLGICLGLQMAVVDYARNVCKLNAFSSEMFENRSQLEGKDIVIDLMPNQLELHKKGGTMRLGAYDCFIEKNTLAYDLFKPDQYPDSRQTDQGLLIQERHRHRLEVQAPFVQTLIEHKLVISGKHLYTDNGQEKFLVEIAELPRDIHPYFISIQSHPEFLSRPDKPHPLFKGLIQACLDSSAKH